MEQEVVVRRQIEEDLSDRRSEIEAMQQNSSDHVHDLEKELDQTKHTLSTLNSIFKTMQTDSTITGAGDFRSKYEKALKDAAVLKSENMELDRTRKELAETKVDPYSIHICLFKVIYLN